MFRVSKMRFNKLEERIAYDLNEPRDFFGRATTTRDDWSNFNVVVVRCLLILVLCSEQSLSISFCFFVILFLRMCKSLWCSRRVLCKIEKVRLLQYRDTFLFFNNSEDT